MSDDTVFKRLRDGLRDAINGDGMVYEIRQTPTGMKVLPKDELPDTPLTGDGIALSHDEVAAAVKWLTIAVEDNRRQTFPIPDALYHRIEALLTDHARLSAALKAEQEENENLKDDVTRLYATNTMLVTENARLREVLIAELVKVAEEHAVNRTVLWGGPDCLVQCAICNSDPHTDDCLITRAKKEGGGDA